LAASSELNGSATASTGAFFLSVTVRSSAKANDLADALLGT
jgi:hypothetical protein